MFYLPIIVSLFTLIFVFFLIRQIQKAPSGEGLAIKISQAIKEGAIAFLKRQYRTVAIVTIFLFFILWITLGFKTSLGFFVGVVASASAGFIGMMVSTQSNLKVAEAAKTGLKEAFELSFKGGSVTGFLVVGLGLLVISVFYFLTNDLKALIGLGFGGSLISVFARLGGGIYLKAVEVGNDLVGKVEKEIPEDDPRNPALIADQVGDNVGDCLGMAADLFETFLLTIISAMLLGFLIFPQNPQIVFLPLILGAIAILASILATFFVKLRDKNVLAALYKGLIFSGIISAIGFWPVIKEFSLSLGEPSFKFYFSALIGLLIATGIFIITEYFTSKKYRVVQFIAQSSLTSPATNIITGLAAGMRSPALAIILISLGILISFWLAGMYGLAIATISFLSLTGIIIALDSSGPITENAGGIAKMAGLSEEVAEVTDSLEAVVNTTKALTKAFAIASAGLAALTLFSAYTQELTELGLKVQFFLEDPKVLVGLFIGGLLPFYFGSLAIDGVGRAASKVVEEVRRQLREIAGLMEGTSKPEYGRCVDIVTQAALKEMIFPALLPVITPILIGFLFGPEALGGLLIGAILTGLFLAISMTSGGASWENAKKYIEEGNLGGKGSFALQAAVTGDRVGDLMKDTAGPAINPMIKVLNIVALLIVSFLV